MCLINMFIVACAATKILIGEIWIISVNMHNVPHLRFKDRVYLDSKTNITGNVQILTLYRLDEKTNI
jgi:hypothetical protein